MRLLGQVLLGAFFLCSTVLPMDLKKGFMIPKALETVKEEDNCSICQEDLPKQWPSRFTLCQPSQGTPHQFHTICLTKMLSANDGKSTLDCPNCRATHFLGTFAAIQTTKEFSKKQDLSVSEIISLMRSKSDTLAKSLDNSEALKAVESANVSLQLNVMTLVFENQFLNRDCTNLDAQKESLQRDYDGVTHQLGETRKKYKDLSYKLSCTKGSLQERVDQQTGLRKENGGLKKDNEHLNEQVEVLKKQNYYNLLKGSFLSTSIFCGVGLVYYKWGKLFFDN